MEEDSKLMLEILVSFLVQFYFWTVALFAYRKSFKLSASNDSFINISERVKVNRKASLYMMLGIFPMIFAIYFIYKLLKMPA